MEIVTLGADIEDVIKLYFAPSPVISLKITVNFMPTFLGKGRHVCFHLCLPFLSFIGMNFFGGSLAQSSMIASRFLTVYFCMPMDS